MAEVMNLDPSTGNPVESKRIADANKRAEEAYMKKMESLLGQDLYRMEVFTAEEEEEMEAIRALQEAEQKGREAFNKMSKPEDRIPKAEGGKFPDLTGDGKVTQADILKGRKVFAEGSMMMPAEGMPVDTYDNIPPEEMDEALASQLPDNQMEDSYIDYILDESLDDSEQEYLADALQKDPRLEGILDKVMVTASEFSGAGEVEGPGTGVSDSIPARLSDGEFVFTRKATDQLGADNLQVMMDDAERAYDGGYQMKAEGGMMEDKDPMSQTQEEIEKLMMGANRMPSLQ
tara:strand:- start:532 stop:1398 length:867 start_codon:yes stop_codon:yes gene_type:complete